MIDSSTMALVLGKLTVKPPVVLAPMAGITNAAYRQLCQEQGAGLYVCEMITAGALVRRDAKTLSMLQFAETEVIRSVQLYGVEPQTMTEATRILCDEFAVAHIDLNFGCPVPKVTRKGGGGALPWKRDRLEQILESVVRAAGEFDVPVTMKTRVGIDDEHITYLDAGRIAESAGCAAIALHGRTVAQAYGGQADWAHIAKLVEAVSIPVLGNGDIWEAADALRMVEQTGCAGVVVGRGCLGRPWLFRDLADAFAGKETRALPSLGEVCDMVYRHGELQAHYQGEKRGLTDLRKHVAWYFKGFPVGGETRSALANVSSLEELRALLDTLPRDVPFPDSQLGKPRGRQGTPRRKVALPEGWLDSQSVGGADLSAAEIDISGG